ncbi:MAG: nucleotidyltransferase domain-containing protein [Candidatus Shapirobacteria bacterium]|jgi:predicted nucleotidyltransferase
MRVKNDDLVNIIKETVSHAHKYGQILTMDQLETRLISPIAWEREEIRKVALKEKIKLKTGNGKNREARRKTEFVRQIFRKKFIEVVPIEMVAVTGSVAAGNPKSNDDIDLLVVARANRMWLVRPLITIWLRLMGVGVRRAGSKEKKDDFCLNLWLEDGYLLIPKSKQTLQSAIDMVNMVVIYDKNNVREKMTNINFWAKSFLATGIRKIAEKQSKSLIFSSNFILDGLNTLAFVCQYQWMRDKITSEVVGKHQAFYHPDRI